MTADREKLLDREPSRFGEGASKLLLERMPAEFRLAPSSRFLTRTRAIGIDDSTRVIAPTKPLWAAFRRRPRRSTRRRSILLPDIAAAWR